LSESTQHFAVKRGSERGFGFVFAVIFLLIALYPLVGDGIVRTWSLVVASVLLLVAFVVPQALIIPNKLWFRSGLFIGHGVGLISMGVVYFTVVLPIGLLLRLLGKDLLCLRLDKNARTYWVTREQAMGTMRDQF
jgi:hypothetical protein